MVKSSCGKCGGKVESVWLCQCARRSAGLTRVGRKDNSEVKKTKTTLVIRESTKTVTEDFDHTVTEALNHPANH